MDIAQAEGQIGDLVAWHCPHLQHCAVPEPLVATETTGLERSEVFGGSAFPCEMGKMQRPLRDCLGSQT